MAIIRSRSLLGFGMKINFSHHSIRTDKYQLLMKRLTIISLTLHMHLLTRSLADESSLQNQPAKYVGIIYLRI